MTDPEARLAAALYRSLWGDYETDDPDHLANQPEEWFDPPLTLARAILAIDPTLICPDPEAPALAAAVRQWQQEHPGASFMPVFVIQTAAITAALEAHDE